ncbi:SANT/Myb_domain [Hexamita inflata]|uniref:SANT/Myb domain n=1 Tax=Hexamita inflata TaxID=28002 RepID=A0AA86R856_9EUKA|nr:SANT/Myb domain [Hexamita inflata]
MPRTMQRWTEEEINLLNMMILKYKKNFKYVDIAIPTRSYNQVKSRYFNELRKQQKLEKLAENQQLENQPIETDEQEPIQHIEKFKPFQPLKEVQVIHQSQKDHNKAQWSELSFQIFDDICE